MAESFVGEIRMFAGNFAPAGWALCMGQLLPISENDVLFSLIGTIYGGDGVSTFALPDLRGRIPLHFGSGHNQGSSGGAEQVLLTVNQIPTHNHALMGTAVNGDQVNPLGNVLANSFNVTPYINDAANGDMNTAAVSGVGGNQSHNNFQPYLCLNFIISLYGIYPSRS